MTGYRRDYAQLQRRAELEFAMLMLKIAIMIERKISS